MMKSLACILLLLCVFGDNSVAGAWNCEYTIISNYTAATIISNNITQVPYLVLYVNYPVNNSVVLNRGFAPLRVPQLNSTSIVIQNPCGSTNCTVGGIYNISFTISYADNSLICWPFLLSQTGAYLDPNGVLRNVSGFVPAVTWADGNHFKAAMAVVMLFLIL
jgi:hypothetical protein